MAAGQPWVEAPDLLQGAPPKVQERKRGEPLLLLSVLEVKCLF